jgi:hypothetical protein
VIYLSGVSTPGLRRLAEARRVGLIAQPGSYGPGACFDYAFHALDNGCFRDQWDETAWLRWLDRMPRLHCLFAVVPDVLCDPVATLRRWEKYEQRVSELGFPRAFVLQNGQEHYEVPPAEAVFIGGDSEWKTSPAAFELAARARARGAWAHMGRVNTAQRYRLACSQLVDSADGTYLAFGPRANLPSLCRWLDRGAQLRLVL